MSHKQLLFKVIVIFVEKIRIWPNVVLIVVAVANIVEDMIILIVSVAVRKSLVYSVVVLVIAD